MEKSSNRTIAKNTIFMYFRMALVTIVGLYTSRVIIATLGVDDYGIYTVAGSVVALFGFVTGALGQSSSRYITVELGKVKDGDINSLISCFKTTRTIHGILALIILVICETIGLWILYHSSIPEERMTAAFWVFQISVVTAMLHVVMIPYTALIIAHERMGIYAYISIFEAVAKLLVCYLLIMAPFDKLIYYAILLFAVQLIVFFIYRFFCQRKFAECSIAYGFDRTFFRPIMSFSFWNLFGSLSYSALTQGTTIIVSIFFGPAVVAGRAIANQVKQHVVNFVNSFRTAINPQILKRNAAGETESYKQLLMWSANISFYMMLAFVLPLILTTDFILDLWLKEVPPYASAFLKIALIEMLFYVYDVTFYQIFQAEGRLKENAIICPVMDLIGLAIVYVIYLIGGGVLAIAWAMLILTILQGMIVKPWLAIKMFGFTWSDFIMVFINNIKVLVGASILPIVMYACSEKSLFVNISLLLISILAVIISSYFVGMTSYERQRFNSILFSKIKHH